MTKITRLGAIAAVALTISGCSGNDAPEADKITETQMDDVDVIDGTISDDMVDVDTIQTTDATGEEETDSVNKKADDATAAEADSTEESTE